MSENDKQREEWIVWDMDELDKEGKMKTESGREQSFEVPEKKIEKTLEDAGKIASDFIMNGQKTVESIASEYKIEVDEKTKAGLATLDEEAVLVVKDLKKDLGVETEKVPHDLLAACARVNKQFAPIYRGFKSEEAEYNAKEVAIIESVLSPFVEKLLSTNVKTQIETLSHIDNPQLRLELVLYAMNGSALREVLEDTDIELYKAFLAKINLPDTEQSRESSQEIDRIERMYAEGKERREQGRKYDKFLDDINKNFSQGEEGFVLAAKIFAEGKDKFPLISSYHIGEIQRRLVYKAQNILEEKLKLDIQSADEFYASLPSISNDENDLVFWYKNSRGTASARVIGRMITDELSRGEDGVVRAANIYAEKKGEMSNGDYYVKEEIKQVVKNAIKGVVEEKLKRDIGSAVAFYSKIVGSEEGMGYGAPREIIRALREKADSLPPEKKLSELARLCADAPYILLEGSMYESLFREISPSATTKDKIDFIRKLVGNEKGEKVIARRLYPDDVPAQVENVDILNRLLEIYKKHSARDMSLGLVERYPILDLASKQDRQDSVEFNEKTRVFITTIKDSSVPESLKNSLKEEVFNKGHLSDLKQVETGLRVIQKINNIKNKDVVGIFFTKNRYPGLVDMEKMVNIAGLFDENTDPIKIRAVANNIDAFLSFDTLNPEKFLVCVELVTRIDMSPSQEIKRIADGIIRQVMEAPNPVEAYKKIEMIFIKNNLPAVGKIFKVFQVLNPPEVIDAKLRQADNLSPYLKKSSPRRRQYTLYRDLMRVHIDSGNRSLVQYLSILSEGQQMIELMDNGELDTLPPDSPVLKQLKHFIAKLNTLFLNSQLEQPLNTAALADELDIKAIRANYEQLRKSLLVKSGQKVTDRIAEMFLRPLGFDNIDQVLRRVQDKKDEAHKRGLEYARRAENGVVTVEAGDLLKGVDERYLENILQNGSVAKEFLGSGASSDGTPLDTDLEAVSKENAERGSEYAIAASSATGYGEVIFVIKNRGQLQLTNAENVGEYDKNKLELFYTKVVSPYHVGVRTGFPSTEIDFIVLKKSNERHDKLFFEIAKNGFYIPVTDEKGKIIFTPEQFEERRRCFDGIDKFGGGKFEYIETTIQDKNFTTVEKIREGLDEVIASTEKMKQNINSTVEAILTESGVELKEMFDTGIVGAELLDTGSTGRHTNMAGQYDFDLALKIDETDISKVDDIIGRLKKKWQPTEDNSHPGHSAFDLQQLRFAGAKDSEGNTFDVDIAFVRKAERTEYGSHDAVNDRLEWVKNNVGEKEYKTIIANIILTKEILKKGGAYKKADHGGIGGIGVENWILANGGNMLKAFQSFREAAFEKGQAIPLQKFREKYHVFDPGVNVKFNKHDDYIADVLTEGGYASMLRVINDYLG